MQLVRLVFDRCAGKCNPCVTDRVSDLIRGFREFDSAGNAFPFVETAAATKAANHELSVNAISSCGETWSSGRPCNGRLPLLLLAKRLRRVVVLLVCVHVCLSARVLVS